MHYRIQCPENCWLSTPSKQGISLTSLGTNSNISYIAVLEPVPVDSVLKEPGTRFLKSTVLDIATM